MGHQRHDRASLERAAMIIAALDSTLRIQILLKLREREHVVHELVSSLGKSQPLISQHLRVLKRAGIVDSRRSGREVAYRLSLPEATTLIDMAADVGATAAEHRSGQRRIEHDGDGDGGGDGAQAALNRQKAAVFRPAMPSHADMPGLYPNTPEPPPPTGTVRQ